MMYIFFQQSKHFGFAFIFLTCNATLGVFQLLLFYHFGQMATESFEKMADCLYESKWYDVQVKTQKCFIILIANTQKPIHYTGFGVIYLNMVTYTKVNLLLISF